MSKRSLELINPAVAYPLALLACVATTIAATALGDLLDLTNVAMMFLLTVFLIALKLNRDPAVAAAFLSVALFDFFFVPPRFTMAVSEFQYVITLSVMLVVALTTAHLTTGLQQQAALARVGEKQQRRLYELARDLAGSLSTDSMQQMLNVFLKAYGYAARLHLLDQNDVLTGLEHDPLATVLARTAITRREPVEADALAGTSVPLLFLPLVGQNQVLGVIAITTQSQSLDMVHHDRDLLMTVASLIAISTERLHYVDLAHASQIQATSERLRSSVLSALSHDIRTPLTALVGLADSLASAKEPLSLSIQETATAIRDQSLAISDLLSNLLEMARLKAGKTELRKDWQLFEDVISASMQILKRSLASHPVSVSLQPNLPLIEFDAVLLERVICNLLENAAKYSSAGSPIEVSVYTEGSWGCIAVCDRGCGFPADKLDAVFEMFARGSHESSTPGTGLGLAICRAIVEAHGGIVTAKNRDGSGACVTLQLPLGTPPILQEEELPASGEVP